MALQQVLEEILTLGAHLIAISPQTSRSSRLTVEKNGLTFHVLSDVGNMVARRFGLVFQPPPDLRDVYQSLGVNLPRHNGDQSFELPLAATYVIASDGSIRDRYIDADYVKRMEPADILAALRTIQQPN